MDILSIQCKMSLRGLKSMRKVDGLSIFFIDFYVPALTEHLNSTDGSWSLLYRLGMDRFQQFFYCWVMSLSVWTAQKTPFLCCVQLLLRWVVY
jgi:hypothetical protein